MPPLFQDIDERKDALIVCAGIAAHALIQKPFVSEHATMDKIIRASFEFAEAFLAEAEKRLG